MNIRLSDARGHDPVCPWRPQRLFSESDHLNLSASEMNVHWEASGDAVLCSSVYQQCFSHGDDCVPVRAGAFDACLPTLIRGAG